MEDRTLSLITREQQIRRDIDAVQQLAARNARNLDRWRVLSAWADHTLSGARYRDMRTSELKLLGVKLDLKRYVMLTWLTMLTMPKPAKRRFLLVNVGEIEAEYTFPTCTGCGNTIDPTTCGCGDPIRGGWHDGHAPVPMGCDCYRVA
jgi:hypothetical protein